MSFSVNYRTNGISLTRGDTFKAKVTITDSEGAPYQPNEGDKIRFAMKKDYDDEEPLLLINIPIDTMIIIITQNIVAHNNKIDEGKEIPCHFYC